MFYTETAALGHDTVVLQGAEGRHASTVRRLRPGESVLVGDGCGLVASCVVSSVARGSVSLSVLSRRSEPYPDPSVTVLQAIPKGDRGELAVEEMTEVGVDRIVPWMASRSVPAWGQDAYGVAPSEGPGQAGQRALAWSEGPGQAGQRALAWSEGPGQAGERALAWSEGPGQACERALARWRAKARESAKQSLRAWVPAVASAADTACAAGLAAAAACAVLLDPGAALPLAALPVPAAGDLVIIVGPEGGITPDEAAAFLAAGATACRLGPSVLRTSTAGAVASAILLSRTSRWQP